MYGVSYYLEVRQYHDKNTLLAKIYEEEKLTVYLSARKTSLPRKCKFIFSCVEALGAMKCFLKFSDGSSHLRPLVVTISP